MIKRATDPQTHEETNIALYRDFYDGQHGVLHTDRQNEYLGAVDADLPDSFGNVCKRAIATIADRLKIEPDGAGIIAVDNEAKAYADAVSGWWRECDLNSKQVELHSNLLKDREAALIIEWDDTAARPLYTVNPIWDGGGSTPVRNRVQAGVRFHYDSRDQLIFVSKHWIRDDRDTLTTDPLRVNLYEPGRIWRGLVDESGQFILMERTDVSAETDGQVTENPQAYPVQDIPIVHFKNFPYLSELTDIIKIQKVLNHSLGSIDIAFDYHSAPGFTAEEFNPVKDATGTEVPQAYGPEKVLVGKGMNRVAPPELVRMWESGVDRWIDMISLIKGWPMWLLNPRVAIPSGIALRMLEAPLVAQVEDKQFSLSLPWLKSFDIGRQLHNYYVSSEQLDGQIKLAWRNPATVDVLESRKVEVETAKASGLSNEWIWTEIYGMEKEQIAALVEEQNRQQEQQEKDALAETQIEPTTGTKENSIQKEITL
jgi:hypothetical protein